jgi:DNA-directed RNA polymerase subunit A"
LEKKLDLQSKNVNISPGEAVGVLAAESLGEPSTQMVLRAFHSAGIASAVVVTGLPRIEEIIDAKKKPKSPSMHIKLEKGVAGDYEKVREIRRKIEEVRVGSLLKGFSEDLKGGVMLLYLDKEKMAAYEVTQRSVVSRISKMERIEVSTEGDNTLKIKAIGAGKKRADMKEARTAFVNVRTAVVFGIKGIKKAIVQQTPDKKGYYIETSGSELEEVIKIEGVDKRHVYTNNIFEMLHVYGIEAARNLIANELNMTMANEGAGVSFRHISLVADAMTHKGIIMGVGRHGIAGSKESVLARAAFEETVKHFINASVFGERDMLKGVAENILIGKQVSVGTGTVRLSVRKEDLKKIKKA